MSRIDGLSNHIPVQPLTPQAPERPSSAPADSSIGTADRLELSEVGHWLNALKANEVRTDKVAAIRAQIEAGTYEDDQKLDVAIDRLLDELAD